jgi:uncharacterized protein (DUF885 family)
MRVFAQTAVFVLASSLLSLAAPAATLNDADAAYVALAHSYYYGNFGVDPIDATHVGVHDYDDQIGDFSAAGIANQLATDHEYLAKLNAIDASSLSPSVALDRTLLKNTLLDDLLLNETLAQLIPRMLHDAEANVTSVDAVTQHISAEDAEGAVDFFKTSVPEAFAAVPDASLQGEISSPGSAFKRRKSPLKRRFGAPKIRCTAITRSAS